MNNREALWALLDGKKITSSHWAKTEYVQMVEDTFVSERGLRAQVCFTVGDTCTWSLYVEPNPHTVGTFQWALFEVKAGNSVRRATWSNSKALWSRASGVMSLPLDSFDATDWEHTK